MSADRVRVLVRRQDPAVAPPRPEQPCGAALGPDAVLSFGFFSCLHFPLVSTFSFLSSSIFYSIFVETASKVFKVVAFYFIVFLFYFILGRRNGWQPTPVLLFFNLEQILFIYFPIFISWRLITLQYCSGFCHTLWEKARVGCFEGTASKRILSRVKPLQYSCLGNPMDRGAWQATVDRVAKSRT